MKRQMIAALIATAVLLGGITSSGSASENSLGEFTTSDQIDGSSAPAGIALGPDGSMWFAQWGDNSIGRITTAKVVTEFAVPTAGANPRGIAAGPDGNMWFTEYTGHSIGRITMDGVITEFAVPTAGATPVGIAAGPDGSMWFTEYAGNKIGRITMNGVVKEFAVPTAGSVPFLIAAGPDGSMWFTERVASRISSVGTGKGRSVMARVAGRAEVGSTLRCKLTNESGWAAAATSRVWFRNGLVIPGATRRSYVVRDQDAGQNLTCRVAVTFSPALNQMGAKTKPRPIGYLTDHK